MTVQAEVHADSQAELVEFLARPDTYLEVGIEAGGEIGEVTVIETHISLIFLAGARAFKLKRAVAFPYLDFTNLQAREKACAEEVRLNSRAAPDLYLGTLPVMRKSDGCLSLGHGEVVVDWLVCMHRFDQDLLFDRLAERGALSPGVMEELAREIHGLHIDAKIFTGRGGREQTEAILANNLDCLGRYGRDIFEAGDLKLLTELSHRHLGHLAPILDARRADGFVRECHGDLHLRNIVLIDGHPVLFDGIEFSQDFSIIDILYDFAFLLMDLCHKGLDAAASAVFNRYMDFTGDIGGLSCLPLFLSLRAAVRAHVAAATADGGDAGTGNDARAYLAEAIRYLKPPPPRLVAIGGLSGTGKSALAARIASNLGAPPGALVLRSDVLRKRLAGADLFDRLAPADYSKHMTERVYARLIADARIALKGGYWVILDAVYARPEQRLEVRRLAEEIAGEVKDFGGFSGFWLELPLAEREQRISRRTGNVSDATVDVARQQEAYVAGEMDWNRVDASQDIEILENRITSPLSGAAT